ncbi:AAA family ATPase [Acidomonas methanolica]|uniref:Transcriptional regulator MoxR n=2 Tax=Acidomonas methanolica TaxID=437 RepID=A0A023D782_ACIMT|nr:MoxR family ATPase [Acidomonas methanolica]MBU2653962.1 MoxR family ATPase [Acidomonas methanolica]TCS30923.1 MoxR-like ATPase [Acidomonas methanolica]GAJ29949.1 transcriptional regulator MoxR [Acidomonas methanolica NBRC 104435]GEK98280.1 ATPase AAA [Acidomonas methanolica NBRC 104435]
MSQIDPFSPTPEDSAAEDAQRADRLTIRLAAIRAAMERTVFGQPTVIEQLLVTVLSGGHALLVGAPGLGKTLLVTTAATVLGLDTRRVQFTPDLMPSDITGAEILDHDEEGRRVFRFVKGPIFAQMLLADEINRASPRTQSALLQAMQEYRVTQSGVEHGLPRPFHVLATQNPIEQEGTYPLPEAQLDRFMLRILLDFPDFDAERQMLIATTGVPATPPPVLFSASELIEAQALVRRLPVGEKTLEAILRLVRGLRPETAATKEIAEALAYGPGPRAAQSLMLACRARALIDGRLAPSPDDVAALAEPVLAHRMALNFAARASGVRLDALIAGLGRTLL